MNEAARSRWASAFPILSASGLATLGSLPVFLFGAQGSLIMADLNQGEVFLGVAIALFYSTAALSIILAGRLTDRFGGRFLVPLGGALAASASFAIGWGSDSAAQTLAAVSGLGAANAALQLAANVSLSTRIPATRRGLGFGVKQAAAPLAIMLAGLALPVVGTQYGWRASYLGLSAMALVPLGFGIFGLRFQPETRAPQHVGPQGPPRRAMWSSVTAMALASAALTSVAAYAASWAVLVGLTLTEAGLLIATGSALNIIGRLVSGGLADRRSGRHLPVVYRQMLVGDLALFAVSIDNPWTFVPTAVIVMTVGWSWPGLFLFAVIRVGRDRTTSAAGWLQAGAFVGGASGPLLFGLLVESVGYTMAWQCAAVAMIASAILVLLARRDFIADMARRPLSPMSG